MQVPVALQVPAPVQMLPSVQVVPGATGEWVTPAIASQLSAVHGLLSSIVGGVPAAQVPEPLHNSRPSQALPLEQEVATGTGI